MRTIKANDAESVAKNPQNHKTTYEEFYMLLTEKEMKKKLTYNGGFMNEKQTVPIN